MKFSKTTLLIATLSTSLFATEVKQSIDLGVTVAEGNAETSLINLAYKLESKWDNKTLSSANYANYGENKGTTSVAQILGNTTYKISDGRYFTKTRFDYRHDALSDINYRLNLTQTIGKEWIKNDVTLFSNEIGLGYIAEDVIGNTHEDLTVFYGHEIDHKITETSSFFHDLSVFVPSSETDLYYSIANFGVKSSLSESLSLQISIQSRYENSPAPGTKHHDFLLVSGVSYNF